MKVPIEVPDDFADNLVLLSLFSLLEDLEKVDNDPHETRDNQAHKISALYTVIKMYMTNSDYHIFIEDRKNGSEITY